MSLYWPAMRTPSPGDASRLCPGTDIAARSNPQQYYRRTVGALGFLPAQVQHEQRSDSSWYTHSCIKPTYLPMSKVDMAMILMPVQCVDYKPSD